VHNVHTFAVGLGRIGDGLGRIGYVSGEAQCLQGLECSSSPTSGTVFPEVSGVLPSDCAQIFSYCLLRGLFCWWPLLGRKAPFHGRLGVNGSGPRPPGHQL
jgi:hypothetical protein